MKRSTLVYTLFIAALTVIFMAFNGCDTLRFSPTESQKQAAQLGADTTAQIRLNGTSPGSAESVIANESAKTTQTYFGLPKQPPQAPEVVIPQAQADAAKRPDPWEVADSVLAIGLSIAGVVGGASGVKLAREISTAQKKSKALREVITANQNFRDELKMKAANPDETLKAAEILQSLKDINGSIQSPETEVLVTEVKSAMPEKLTASLRPASLKQVPFKSEEPAV